jgi:hypothetical protein
MLNREPLLVRFDVAARGIRAVRRVGAMPGREALVRWHTPGIFAGMLNREPFVLRFRHVVRGVSAQSRRPIAYSFRYSRRRRVCVRLTGISVAFTSFIRRR